MKIYDALRLAMEPVERDHRDRPFRLTASRVENEWVFWFVFLPATPGMDLTVFVADNGGLRTLPGI